jgi:hypothetical protein
VDYTQEMRSWAWHLERREKNCDLIHGFGFANVLKEFGLPRQELGCEDHAQLEG